MIRNFVIGAVGLLALGAFGCGAQGGSGTETTGTGSDAVLLSGSWATPASMGSELTARWSATSCALDNHRILVAGGYSNTGGSTLLNTAYLFDINSASSGWVAKANLNRARAEAKMVPLGNGKCAIIGGVGVDAFNTKVMLNSIEVFDVSGTNGTWTTQTATLGTARRQFTVSKYSSSKFIVAGGNTAVSGSPTAVADTDVLTFSGTGATTIGRTAGPSLATARYLHAAVNVTDDHLLIAGGENSSGTVLGSSELIDASVGSPAFWAGGTMVTARSRFSLSPLSGVTPEAVAIGGNNAGPLSSAERFDITTWNSSNAGSWATVTGTGNTLATARMDHIALPTGTANAFLIVGGRDQADYQNGSDTIATSEEYTDSALFANAQTFTNARADFVAEYLSGASGSAKILMSTGMKAVSSPSETLTVLTTTVQY